MKPASWLILTYVVFVSQTSLAPLLGRAAPNLTLACLVGCAWFSGSTGGLLGAAAWGLISDGFSHGPLGLDLAAYVAVALCVQLVRGSRSRISAGAAGLLTGCTTFVAAAGPAGIRAVAAGQELDAGRLLAWCGWSACSTALLATVAVLLWRSVRRESPLGGSTNSPLVANRWKMLTE